MKIIALINDCIALDREELLYWKKTKRNDQFAKENIESAVKSITNLIKIKKLHE